MYDDFNYPPGADGPDAPWNEKEVEEREFEVTISQTLSKNTTVYTNDYCGGGYYPEVEKDIDGYHTITCMEPIDTSDTDWVEVYSKEHYTPLELIKEFKKMLESNEPILESKRKHLIEECMDWVEDDFEVCEG